MKDLIKQAIDTVDNFSLQELRDHTVKYHQKWTSLSSNEHSSIPYISLLRYTKIWIGEDVIKPIQENINNELMLELYTGFIDLYICHKLKITESGIKIENYDNSDLNVNLGLNHLKSSVIHTISSKKRSELLASCPHKEILV